MNKWVGIGRLTRAPELRRTGTGKAVATFTLAIDDGYGEKNKSTDFIDIVAWEGLGENCAKYLDKGSKVAVAGKIKKRSYEKDGHKLWVTEIRAQDVEFLESKSKAAPTAPAAAPAPAYPEYPGNFVIMDDDDAELPF